MRVSRLSSEVPPLLFFRYSIIKLPRVSSLSAYIDIFQVLNNVLENERMINEYESLTSDLLKWIEEIIQILNEREFENSLQGVQAQLSQFNSYRTQEKPPK